jgi:FkbM family methyltransferase
MTAARLLGALGTAAVSARRVGLGRALNALLDAGDALLLRAHAPLLKATSEQLELRGYLRHRGFLDYVAHGMREESYYRSLVVAAVDSRTTFIDAGAHIGVYTLLTCRRARRVVAFEPDPYNPAALRRNVRRSGCENVEIRAEAVAELAGHAEFRSFRSTFSGSLTPRRLTRTALFLSKRFPSTTLWTIQISRASL